MNEAARIAKLAAIFGTRAEGAPVGVGDDAAVLDAPTASVVWSIDASVEHVHFERAWLTPESLGYRATMAALSDLAAMGARCRGVLSSLILPRDLDESWFDGIARGQRRAVDAYGTAVLGGNLSRGAELSVTTTVLGEVARPLSRSGARPGDRVWLAGPVGLARAGLEHLLRGDRASEDILDAWRHPFARIPEGLVANAVATAAIDVSDGLALDASRLAEASDVSIEFNATAIVCDALVGLSRALGLAPVDLALHGGEDYALLVTAPPEATFGASFRLVGRVRAPIPGEAPSRVWLTEEGRSAPVPARGFDHFDVDSDRAIVSE